MADRSGFKPSLEATAFRRWSVHNGLPIFHDAEKAREWLESERWPNGPICPRCGTINESTKLKGTSTRPGVYKCRPCKKPFTVTVGTVFEDSKVAEAAFKWNHRSALGIEDTERAAAALRGIGGKRLTYGPPRQAAHA